MVLAALWSVSATWFSAHLLVPVFAELASYWACSLGVVGAWLVHSHIRGELAGSGRLIASPWPGPVSLVLVLASWLLSDFSFFHWKLRAIPREAWSQMVADLRQVAVPNLESAPNTNREPPPASVRQLGMKCDTGAWRSWKVDHPGYPGFKADVLLGYKSRSWGLWVGPEKSLEAWCRGCRRARVTTNSYFFVGPRG
jgi:hypothetical protein